MDTDVRAGIVTHATAYTGTSSTESLGFSRLIVPSLFGQQPGRAVSAPVVASTSCLTSDMRLSEARASQAASSAVAALHSAGTPCPPRVSTASSASLYSRSAASSSTHAASAYMPSQFTDHPYCGPILMVRLRRSFRQSPYSATDPFSAPWVDHQSFLNMAIGNPHVRERPEHRAVGTSDVPWPSHMAQHGDYGSHTLRSGDAYTVPPVSQTAVTTSSAFGWSHAAP